VVALAAVLAAATPGLAQFAPPAPPTEAKPPASPDLPERSSQFQYGTPPFSFTGAQPPEPPGKLPPAGPLQPPPPVHEVPDFTPPEFAGHPITTVCDGCRPCDHPAAFLFAAEYLYMRPRRNDDAFALVDPLANLTPEGSTQRIGFDWASGLRIAAGYRPANSQWENWFVYTYTHAQGTAGAVAPPGGELYAEFTRPGLVDNALTASGSQNLTYNVYDADTLRRIAGDDCFVLKIGFGARYTTIDQNQGAFYNGFNANGTNVANRMTFDGGGVTLAGQGQYTMPWGLSFFGRAKAGLVVGEIRNSLRETDNNGATVNANISDNFYTTIPVLELGTGVAWEFRNFRIAAGYEMTNWFGLNNSPTFINDFAEGKLGRRQSDLSLEGLFVQMGLTF
jgi:hypothetical protein